MKKIILSIIIAGIILVPTKSFALDRDVLLKQIEELFKIVYQLQAQLLELQSNQETMKESVIKEIKEEKEREEAEKIKIDLIENEKQELERIRKVLLEKKFSYSQNGNGKYNWNYKGSRGSSFIFSSEIEAFREFYDIVLKIDIKTQGKEECLKNSAQGWFFIWDENKKECNRSLQSGYYLDCCGNLIEGTQPKNFECSFGAVCA